MFHYASRESFPCCVASPPEIVEFAWFFSNIWICQNWFAITRVSLVLILELGTFGEIAILNWVELPSQRSALTESRSFEACSGFGVLSGLGGPSLLVLSTGFRRKPTIFSQLRQWTNPVSRILGKNSLRMLCFMLEQTVEVLNSDENLLKMHWSFRCMASMLGWSLSKFPRKFATYLSPVAKNCLVSAKIVVLKHCLSVFFWTGAQNVNKHVDFCSVLWCAWSSWRIFLWKERSPSPFYCECTSDRQTYA